MIELLLIYIFQFSLPFGKNAVLINFYGVFKLAKIDKINESKIIKNNDTIIAEKHYPDISYNLYILISYFSKNSFLLLILTYF